MEKQVYNLSAEFTITVKDWDIFAIDEGGAIDSLQEEIEDAIRDVMAGAEVYLTDYEVNSIREDDYDEL